MGEGTSFISKRIGLYIGLATITGIALIGTWWLLTPSWQALFTSDISADSRNAAINHLMASKEPFKEQEETGLLLVNANHIAQIRQELSGMGIPADTRPGLELFGETDYGMSEFTQRINYQRAMEAEIAHTISDFEEVRRARVHLNIPKQSIFRDQQTSPKASVVITTSKGQHLSAEQISGISELVASTVEGLAANKVVVLNESGNILSTSSNPANSHAPASANAIELALTQKARTLIEGFVHPDNVQIAVNATLDYDQMRAVREEIIPIKGTQGLLKKSKRKITQGQASGKDSPKSRADGSDVEEEFVFSTERSEISYASGDIKTLSVGIVIRVDLSEQTLSDIEQVLSAGLGLDVLRGDRISVVTTLSRTNTSITVTPDNLLGGRLLADGLNNNKRTQLDTRTDDTHRSINEQLAHDNSLLNTIAGKRFMSDTTLALIVLACAAAIILVLLSLLILRKPKKTTVRSLSQQELEQLLQEAKTWIAQGTLSDAS